jgi:hypothetical protein
MFAKIDLSNGFWCMLVRKSDKWNFVVRELDRWNFAYDLPGAAGDSLRLIIPHALQMGGRRAQVTSVPPTKPAATICRHSIDGGTELPPHVFELYMSPKAVVRRQISPVADRPCI